MLSKTLYNLILFLSIPYNQLNSSLIKLSCIDTSLTETLISKKLFISKWQEKSPSKLEKTNFKFVYNILDQNSNLIKVKLKIQYFSIINNVYENITSSTIDEYIVILNASYDNFKILFLVKKEDDPILYSQFLVLDLDKSHNIISTELKDLWYEKLSSIDVLFESFSKSTSKLRLSDISSKKFNITKACDYAEKFALTPNPNYKTYDESGGDCTNFLSQIINIGGISFTDDWKPYSYPWIRVEDFYTYFTSQNIATEISEETPLSKGCIIQFYRPKLGRYFHSGFVTYELESGDYLYCCHSYNKLNYPLSAIYPIIYPKLRALIIN